MEGEKSYFESKTTQTDPTNAIPAERRRDAPEWACESWSIGAQLSLEK
jgi:hypothetical protein